MSMKVGRILLVLVSGCVALSSCNKPDGEMPPRPRSFDAEEKRLARKLSLGSEITGQSSLSTGEKASLCEFLIGGLEERFLQTSGDPRLAEGFRKVKAIYHDRAAAASAGGKPFDGKILASDLGEDERARYAMSCISALQ